MKLLRSEERPRARFRRWLLRGVGVLAALCVLLLSGVLGLMHDLDRPWIRQRIRNLLLTSAGVDVEYGHIELSLWSGISIDGIVAHTPGPFSVHAPELARIGHVRARWALSTLLRARPAVSEIEARDVAVSIVMDENGVSSLDAIPTKPSAPTPLSQQARELVDETSPVGHLSLKNASIMLIRTEAGTVVERDSLSGLSVDADAKRAAGGRLDVALGSRAEPLALRFERRRAGADEANATAQLSLSASATPADATASLDIRVVEQNLVPEVRVDQLAHLELQAKFDPARHQSDVELMHANWGDGVLTAEGRAEVPDQGAPLVRRALGDLDAARLLRLLPSDLVPVQLTSGHLHVQVDELAVDRPASSAKLALDADAAGAVHLDATEGGIDGGDLAATFHLSRDPNGTLNGEGNLRFATLERKGKNGATARDGRVQINVRDLTIDPRAPLTARGNVSLEGAVALLETRAAYRAALSDLKFHADMPLSGGAPFAVDAGVDAARFTVSGANGKALIDVPGHLEVELKDITPVVDSPEKSGGEAHLGLRSAAFEARLDATKKNDAITFDLAAKADALGGVRRFLPDRAAQAVPWDEMACELHSRGTIDRPDRADTHIHQQSQLRLTGASLGNVRVPAVSLDFRSDGTATKHDGTLVVEAPSIAVGETALGPDRFNMSLALDRSKPSLQVKFDNEGAVQAEALGVFAVDRADRAVTYDIAGKLAKLGPVAPLLANLPGLAHFDFDQLGLELKSQGHLTGLVTGIDRQGDIVVASNPGRTAAGEGAVELGITKFRWAQGDRAFTVPASTLRATFRGDGPQRRVESDFSAEQIEIGLGRHHISIADLRDQTSTGWTGALGDGTIDLSHRATIRSAQQNFLAMYPVGDVSTTLTARLDTDGLFKIAALQVENGAAGSILSVSGGIDLTADQRRLSLRADLDQNLAHFSTRTERFTGRGNASVELTVESPDFRVFHGRAKLALEGASIRLPRYGIALDDVDGEVPVVTDVTYGRHGLELLRDARLNPYAVLRFADQHPLLSHRSFLSVGSLTTPMMSIAPFAANLRIEQNVISLSQLEMGLRGGSVTGNGIVEWDGMKTQLQTDLHVTGVQSSHGEPFDGNAALVIDMGDRSIEGRADILRIGPRHLLDLLDLQDPRRANAGMNRIRSALDLGYPERVRISFKHGFASAGVTFGGLASLVSVDDVRGIPIGPLMERVVRSLQPREEP